MHTAEPVVLDRVAIDAATLMASHPPRWSHPNKRAVFERACPPRAEYAGTVGWSRWGAMALPERLPERVPAVEVRAGVFDYAPTVPGAVAWTVNFADPELFGFYGGALLAQDELQVLEHPALGALREYLVATGRVARTVDRAGQPTPVLVTGVERRCVLRTEPDVEAGRPEGLYGNRFARAGVEVARQAAEVCAPPTVSHVIAIAAPRGGYGAYTAEDVWGVLRTAATGFRAAVQESGAVTRGAGEGKGAPAVVEVHTGFWGCGAFGGNRELMTAVQLVAARLAGVYRVVVRAFDQAGVAVAERAVGVVEEVAGAAQGEVEGVVEGLVTRGYEWGVSDGS
jgi:hypothetical protein